jgi:cell division protein FtsB
MKTFLNSVLTVLVLLVQYQLWFGEGSLLEIWQLKQSRDAQKLENEDLRERNAALEAEVLDLKQGFEAIKERARTEMGMIKADEIFYQIVGEEDGQNNEHQEKRP